VAAPILGLPEVLAARAFDGVAHQAVLLDDVGHDALGGDRGPVDVFRRAAEYQGDPVDLNLAERRGLCDQLFDLVGVAVAPANGAPLAAAGVSVVAVGVSFVNHADHPFGSSFAPTLLDVLDKTPCIRTTST
jgi:hypothetical protein